MSLFARFLIALIGGAILMVVISFTAYQRSYYYKKAGMEAGLSDKPGLMSRLVTLALLLVMISFVGLFDCWMVSGGLRPAFLPLLGLNLALVAALSLFDALFIDIFILLVWRPAFFHLQEGQPTREAMMRHIRKQMTMGWLFKIPIAMAAAASAMAFH